LFKLMAGFGAHRLPFSMITVEGGTDYGE
jgi:hypothetical protein